MEKNTGRGGLKVDLFPFGEKAWQRRKEVETKKLLAQTKATKPHIGALQVKRNSNHVLAEKGAQTGCHGKGEAKRGNVHKADLFHDAGLALAERYVAARFVLNEANVDLATSLALIVAIWVTTILLFLLWSVLVFQSEFLLLFAHSQSPIKRRYALEKEMIMLVLADLPRKGNREEFPAGRRSQQMSAFLDRQSA
jgi:hypothetical protein